MQTLPIIAALTVMTISSPWANSQFKEADSAVSGQWSAAAIPQVCASGISNTSTVQSQVLSGNGAGACDFGTESATEIAIRLRDQSDRNGQIAATFGSIVCTRSSPTMHFVNGGLETHKSQDAQPAKLSVAISEVAATPLVSQPELMTLGVASTQQTLNLSPGFLASTNGSTNTCATEIAVSAGMIGAGANGAFDVRNALAMTRSGVRLPNESDSISQVAFFAPVINSPNVVETPESNDPSKMNQPLRLLSNKINWSSVASLNDPSSSKSQAALAPFADADQLMLAKSSALKDRLANSSVTAPVAGEVTLRVVESTTPANTNGPADPWIVTGSQGMSALGAINFDLLASANSSDNSPAETQASGPVTFFNVIPVPQPGIVFGICAAIAAAILAFRFRQRRAAAA